jgi:hypothetical protein
MSQRRRADRTGSGAISLLTYGGWGLSTLFLPRRRTLTKAPSPSLEPFHISNRLRGKCTNPCIGCPMCGASDALRPEERSTR